MRQHSFILNCVNLWYLFLVTATCASEFSKVLDQSEDTMTDCTHIGGVHVNTVEDCKRITCSHGGNAFNWKDGICYYKKCEAGQLILNTGTFHGGWNIYAIDAPGICSFKNIWTFEMCNWHAYIIFSLFSNLLHCDTLKPMYPKWNKLILLWIWKSALIISF